jgi:hypothetical protein
MMKSNLTRPPLTAGSSSLSKNSDWSQSQLSKSKKGPSSLRIMTWNTDGLENKDKRKDLDEFIEKMSIDLLFIQEGHTAYHKPVSEKYAGSNDFEVEDKSNLAVLFGSTVIKSNGGTSRPDKPYNVIFDPNKWELVDDKQAVDYAENPVIRDWIEEPVSQAIKEEKIVRGGTTRRPHLVDAEGKKGIVEEVRRETQKRVNMLGQQRPKLLRSKVDDLKIFFVHSPLGGSVDMPGVGLNKRGKTDFSASMGAGSGGQTAPAANALFRLAICGYDKNTHQENSTKDKMKDVIYLGDMNVTEKGIDALFPGMNRATEIKPDGADGLSHILAHPDYCMTTVSNSLNDAPKDKSDLKSDHSWVIVDIDDRKNSTSEPRSGGGAGSSESKAEEKKKKKRKREEEEEAGV